MLTVSIFFFSPVRESSGKVEEKNKERNEKERDRREVGRKRIQCHWRIYRKYKFNWNLLVMCPSLDLLSIKKQLYFYMQLKLYRKLVSHDSTLIATS